MANLPNPFTVSGEPVAPSSDKAATPLRHVAGVAAEIPDGSALLDCRAASQCLNGNLEPDPSETEPTTDGGGPKESPAADAMNPHETVGDLGIDCIGEIFAGARKMFDPDPAAYTREDELLYDVLRAMDDPYAADLIEIPAGLWGEFDPPPLFLQEQMRA
jgi:hypothetical protein